MNPTDNGVNLEFIASHPLANAMNPVSWHPPGEARGVRVSGW